MNLLIAALAPVIVVIFYIFIKDKFEKEPKKLLFYNFLFGAIVSIFISSILYVFYDVYLPKSDDFSVLEQFIKAFFVVALIEEFSKYVIVRFYAQPKSEPDQYLF